MRLLALGAVVIAGILTLTPAPTQAHDPDPWGLHYNPHARLDTSRMLDR